MEIIEVEIGVKKGVIITEVKLTNLIRKNRKVKTSSKELEELRFRRLEQEDIR